jgi:cytochrome P450
MTMLILDSMAYHEMRLIITRVLWNFDLKLRKESENWADQRVFSIWHKGPLMVEVKARAS